MGMRCQYRGQTPAGALALEPGALGEDWWLKAAHWEGWRAGEPANWPCVDR